MNTGERGDLFHRSVWTGNLHQSVSRLLLPPAKLTDDIQDETVNKAKSQSPLERTVESRLATSKQAFPVENSGTKNSKESRMGMSALEAAVRSNMEIYSDAILLTQVGSFFEVRAPSPSASLSDQS
jgi:hypothetical protein